MRFHLPPLGVGHYKTVHPECESHLPQNRNPKSPQPLVVGAHWTLKVQDGDRFYIAGSSADRATVEALAERLSANCIACGDQPIITVRGEETVAA